MTPDNVGLQARPTVEQPTHSSRLERGLNAILLLGAGLILGAFISRILAELAWVTWPIYRPVWSIVCTVLVCTALLGLRWAICRSWDGGASWLPFWALLLYLLQPTPNLLQAGAILLSALTVFVLLGWKQSRIGNPDRWIALALFVAAMVAYLITLTPAVGTRDGYELQAISATLGFAHPTGYPLFPILGRIWLLGFPFGSIAWRINVLCALFAAGSVPLIYATARRILGHRPSAALGALVFAVTRTLWTQAVRPEKYTLNAFFVALVLYIALGTVNPKERGPHPHLRWLAFVYGLSLGHHRTMLMLAPALGIYVLWRDPGLLRRPREWLTALGIALAPLLIYLYIPWRAAAQGWMMTLPEFLRYISGAYYSPAIRLMDWANPVRVQMFWRFLLDQFGYLGITLGLLGWIGLALRGRWRTLGCTTIAYATYYFWGTVWYAYYNDVNSFIPNHLIFAIWIGSGVLLLWEWLGKLWGNPHPTFPLSHREQRDLCFAPRGRAMAFSAIFWTATALLPAWLVWTNGPLVDASTERNLTSWGEYAIAQDLAPGATVLADREKHPPLDYFARIEARRPDLDVAILGDENAYLDRLFWDLAHDKTVYLARFLPGLETQYHLRSVGPLVEVGTIPIPASEVPHTVGTGFGESIELLTVETAPEGPLHAGESLYLDLYWHTRAPVPGNYQVTLRLVGSKGQVWWQKSDHPVSGMYPTGAWKVGEAVRDWHEIPIEEAVPPGTYQVQIGLLQAFSEDGLATDDGTPWFTVTRLEVEGGPYRPRIPHPLRIVRDGEWQILGYDLPDRAPPTGRVPLILYWQALSPLPDLEVGWRLVSERSPGEWTWQVLGRGEYPSAKWEPGRTVITEHELTMPTEQGPVAVEVAVRRVAQAGEPTTRLSFSPHWLGTQRDVFVLPTIEVAGRPPATPGTSNYADRILLLQADPSTHDLTPGAPLDLAVRWQCLQAMDEDYTLFVQFIAPDGLPRGQIDVWPQEGTNPTSAWQEGQVIEDQYRIYLDEDAPAGSYGIAIGWYLLETMQRLPVLDESGTPIADHVMLSGLAVNP